MYFKSSLKTTIQIKMHPVSEGFQLQKFTSWIYDNNGQLLFHGSIQTCK
jgi:hypothetical protein